MRIICFGSFIDYQIQLANTLSKKETVMLVIPVSKLPSAYLGNIDNKVDFHLLGKRKLMCHPANFLIFKDFVKKVNEFKPDVIHQQLGGGVLYLTLKPNNRPRRKTKRTNDARIQFSK
jgi:hypothetical protein